MNDKEISDMFNEIAKFRKIGLLQSKSRLRALEVEFSDNVSHTPYGDCLRLIEEEVLFEMSRRYYNQIIQSMNEVE